MREEWRDVDPELAEKWLRSNTRNRNLRQMWVETMANDMLNGRWVPSPADCIIFGADGDLYDGQHRLNAIVRSGVTLRLRVIFDAPTELLVVIDTGHTRKPGDQLRIQHVPNSNQIAAAVRVIISYDKLPGRVWNGANSISTPEVVAFAKEHLDDLLAADQVGGAIAKDRSTPLPRTPVTAFVYLLNRDSAQDSSVIEDYLDGLVSGANLSVDDPRLALRRFTPSIGGSRNQQVFLGGAIKAWNAFVEDRPIKLLRWRREELPMVQVV